MMAAGLSFPCCTVLLLMGVVAAEQLDENGEDSGAVYPCNQALRDHRQEDRGISYIAYNIRVCTQITPNCTLSR